MYKPQSSGIGMVIGGVIIGQVIVFIGSYIFFPEVYNSLFSKFSTKQPVTQVRYINSTGLENVTNSLTNSDLENTVMLSSNRSFVDSKTDPYKTINNMSSNEWDNYKENFAREMQQAFEIASGPKESQP
jgi:hypothetical protein|tara:strand:+ start:1163 stop:1549 length:387 start_codon:yes stop_codon:yes gene_type:complete